MIRTFIFIFLFPFFLIQAEKSVDLNQPIHQVINKYRNSPAVDMKLKKTMVSTLLGGDPKISFGQLYLSQGNMRYEITEPEKHLVVVNGKSIWVENRLSKEMGGKIQAIHLKSKAAQNKVKGFMAAFFGNSNIKEDIDFKFVSDGLYSVEFKKKDSAPDIKSAHISLDSSKEKINYIEYTDSIENKTRHDFSKVKFKKNKNDSKFEYSMPANAEKTVM